MSDITNDDGPESKSKDPNWSEIDSDNPNKLYGIYDWMLAVSVFLTSKNFFFFFFLDSMPAKVSVALRFRFCFFLVIFSKFLISLSPIFSVALVAVYIFLAFLAKAFLAKPFTFFIFFDNFFFSTPAALRPFLATLAYFFSRVNSCFLPLYSLFFNSLHSIFVLVSGIWLLIL